MPESKSQLISHCFKLTTVLFIYLLLLTGCRELLPYRTSQPEISGVLLQNGAPLADVVIYSCLKGSNTRQCPSYKKTATDSQGHFYFDTNSEIISHVSQFGDSSFKYNISFLYNGRDYHWSASGGEMPDNVNLRCDISHQELCTVHNFSN